MKFYRHGDVNLHPAKEIKGKAIPHDGNYILAHGEATGSVHNIAVKDAKDMVIYETENGERYIKLLKEALLTHTTDHLPLTIQPGIYHQVQERELDWFSEGVERSVID